MSLDSPHVKESLMSSGVERARSLEREEIPGDRAQWNLSAAALYEEAVRRGEGLMAAEGPLVCRTGQHTGRSPNDKFIVREPSSERRHRLGRGQPADGRRPQFDALHRDLLASLDGQGTLRPGLLRRRRSRATGCRSASSPSSRGTACSRATCSSSIPRPARGPAHAAVHDHRRAELQGRSRAPRHALGRRHRAQFRQAARAHRRHELRRRDQEVDLHAS